VLRQRQFRNDTSGAWHIRHNGPQSFPRTQLSKLGLSLVKTWSIRERFSIQFRGEFFNILNHPNFTNPFGVGGQLGNVDPSSPSSFGYASETPDVAAANPVMGSGGNRAVQLGLKLKF
jgi:hypothetical protein